MNQSSNATPNIHHTASEKHQAQHDIPSRINKSHQASKPSMRLSLLSSPEYQEWAQGHAFRQDPPYLDDMQNILDQAVPLAPLLLLTDQDLRILAAHQSCDWFHNSS
jgi:hypothetical protein